jgi:glucokinase
MRPSKKYLGIDIGGTKCAVLVGTAAGEVLGRQEFPSIVERGPREMIAEIVDRARQLMRGHGRLAGAGVAIGGPLDAESGVVYDPPNLPGWHAIKLSAQLEQKLGLHVDIEHDAAACALAEYYWGAGKAATRLAYLTCGTGFGSGFVFDGKIYRGARGNNSEVGHVRLSPDGPTAFGKAGSAEAFCSAGSLPKLAAWMFPRRWRTRPPLPSELASLNREGDEEASAVLNRNATAVGNVCAMLADLLRLDLILLGSLGRYLGRSWVKTVKEEFSAEAHPISRKLCKVRAAGLGKRLQDCSALAVACEYERRIRN